MARQQLGPLADPSSEKLGVPTVSQLYAGFTPPSGAWQQPINMLGSSPAASSAGNVSWMPVDIGPNPMTIQALGVNCTTAQVGGTTAIYLGLYADDGSGGMPLLSAEGRLEAGTITAAGTGARTLSVSRTLQPGRYWTAFLLTQSAAPTTAPQWSCNNNPAPALWVPNGVQLASAIRALRLTGQSALPTSPATLTVSGSNDAPAVCIRRA